MSVEPTPESKQRAGRNKLLIIIGSAIVVLLAIIAVAVSSQAIREVTAEASASASAKAVIDTREALADAAEKDQQEAQNACQSQVLIKHPTASFEGRYMSTRTELKMGGEYQTVGAFTDEPLYKNSMSMQYVCSTTKTSNGGWDSTLTALGRQ